LVVIISVVGVGYANGVIYVGAVNASTEDQLWH
jgi:hypothetical protein